MTDDDPRRPTRDQGASRVKDLEQDRYPGLDEGLTVCEILSYKLEPVDGTEDVVRIVETGELRRLSPDSSDAFGDLLAQERGKTR